MWHVLRTELAYFRPWLLGSFGIAAGVVLLVSFIFYAVGDDGPPSHAAAGIRGMFLLMGPMIVGFVAQAYRGEERRMRLLLAAPLTPAQLAAVAVLVPLTFSAVGILVTALVMGAESLVTGRLEREALHLVAYVGGLLFLGLMLGLLAQEATAAHRQRRRRAAIAGWSGFVAAVLLLAALSVAALYLAAPQGFLTWTHLHLGNLGAALVVMVGNIVLFASRTDFTH